LGKFKYLSKKIFISHSSVDKRVGKVLMEALVKMGVPKNNIFFSSCDGNNVSVGDLISEGVRDAILECDLAILLLSKNYYKSEFCLNEMGVFWFIKKKIIPIIIDNLEVSTIKGFIDNKHVFINWYDAALNDNESLLKKLNEIIGIDISVSNLNLLNSVKDEIVIPNEINYNITYFLTQSDKNKFDKIINKKNKLLFKNINLEDRLNKIFNSQILIDALMDSCKEDFCYDLVMIKLSSVLIYYLYTRDVRVSYDLLLKIMMDVNYKKRFPSKNLLFEGLKNIYPNKKDVEYVKILQSNAIFDGYAIHSFNPLFLDYISKNGLGVIDDKSNAYKNLIDLENIIYKNKFAKRQTDAKFYYTLPSANAMHYACCGCPERVFGGPLKELNSNVSFFDDISAYNMMPIIVGESVKKHYKRVACNNLKIVSKISSIVNHLRPILKRKYKKLVNDFCCDYSYMLLIPYNNKVCLNAFNKTVDLNESQTIFEYFQKETGKALMEFKNFDECYEFVKSITPKAIGMNDETNMGNLCTNQIIKDFSNIMCIKVPVYFKYLQKYCLKRYIKGTKVFTELSPYVNNAFHCVKDKNTL